MNTANLRRLLDEATPRPWVHEDGSYWIRDPAQPEYIGLVECHDSAMNAALIVELVNSADELLAENELLRAVVRAAKKFVEHVDSGCGWQCASCRNDDEDCDCGYIELVDAVEALEQKP